MPAATAVPAPVLEPPGVRSGSQGLRAGGKWSASVAAASKLVRGELAENNRALSACPGHQVRFPPRDMTR